MLALLANSHTAISKDQHSVYTSFCQYLLGSDIHTIVFHVFCNNNLLFSINLALLLNLHVVCIFETQCSKQSPMEANLTFNLLIDLNNLLTLTSYLLFYQL